MKLILRTIRPGKPADRIEQTILVYGMVFSVMVLSAIAVLLTY